MTADVIPFPTPREQAWESRSKARWLLTWFAEHFRPEQRRFLCEVLVTRRALQPRPAAMLGELVAVGQRVLAERMRRDRLRT